MVEGRGWRVKGRELYKVLWRHMAYLPSGSGHATQLRYPINMISILGRKESKPR